MSCRHHLLPTMPRYRYPSAAPLVRQLCAEHGVEYRVDSELGVVRRNFAMLREVARAGAEEGALPTRTETVWSRRDGAAWGGVELEDPFGRRKDSRGAK